MKKKLLALAMALVLLLSLAACAGGEGESSGSGEGSESGLTLSETEKTLKIGETFQLTASEEDVSWITGDSSVATVTDGLVTAVSEGETVITATLGESRTTCQIKVEALYFPTLRILDKASTLFLNYTYDMEAELAMGDEPIDAEITWKSSDESVATIDADGHLVPAGEGKVTITASATVDGAYLEDSIEALVMGLSYIEGPETLELGLYAGDRSMEVPYTIYLNDEATEEKAEATIDDANVATIAEDGSVEAVAEGETVLHLSYNTDVYQLSLDIPVTVEKHILHTFSEENTSYYTGDVPREGGDTIGTYWTTRQPKVDTSGVAGGQNATPLYIFAYYYDPAVSFPMELTKQELYNYMDMGYSKIVVPIYSDNEYAEGIQLECGGYLSPELPNGGWKEVEFPLYTFINNYDSYTVEGTPIIWLKNMWMVYPTATGGKEVSFNIYIGDIYLR